MLPRLFLLLFLIPTVVLADEQVVYCEDPDVIADWSMRAERSPNDLALQTLHALWLGLCDKVRDGSIDARLAIQLFERERNRQVEKRITEEQSANPLIGL